MGHYCVRFITKNRIVGSFEDFFEDEKHRMGERVEMEICEKFEFPTTKK